MTKTPSLYFLLLAIACICSGCHSTAGRGVADFKDANSWDVTKQQRWETFHKAMAEHSDEIVESNEQADGGRLLLTHWTTPEFQAYLDKIEQRRTGDPAARSCRKADAPARRYDYRTCSLQQLSAELFQETEELHAHVNQDPNAGGR